MINITLNGKKESIDKKMSISDLLKSKKIRPQLVTVELNDKIIDKADFKTTVVDEDDRLEFVYFMGGGQK